MTRQQAEAKFVSAPIHLPRFLVSTAEAAAVKAAAKRQERISIRCRQIWASVHECNLVCDVPGTNPALANEPVLVWAYADGMSICPDRAPAADQGSGAVAMLELARLVATLPHERPLRFVLSGAHCLNLAGAREYVERHLADPVQPIAVVTLDLSTSSKVLCEFGRGYGYDYRDELLQPILPLCRVLRRHAEALTPLLGETNPRVVLTDGANHSDNRTWKNNIPATFTFDCEPFASAGYNAITFATADDERARFDTVDDTLDHVHPENLLRQVQVLAVMLHHLANDRLAQTGDESLPLQPPSPSKLSLVGGFATLTGYAALYEPAKNLVPDTRVGNALAVRFTGRKSLMGVRADDVEITGPRGEYRFVGAPPLTDYASLQKPPTTLAAYHLDESGEIDMAPDQGITGSGAFPLTFQLKTAFRSSPIVLFRCETQALFGLVDPQDLTPLTNWLLLDPTTGASPVSYGVALAFEDPQYWTGIAPPCVLFLQPGSRWQVSMGSSLGDWRMILTGSTPTNLAGTGYSVTPSFGPISLASAQDIDNIDQGRLDEFARYRLVTGSLLETHNASKAALARARAAAANLDWLEADRQARAAWGLALRAHPVLQRTASDIVNGVLLYSFLLIPFSFFLERLLFANRKLAVQLGATIAIFIASFLILRFVHTAFDLVANPSMIFVGFIMGALSLIVMAFITSKFEGSLREVRQTATGIKDLDVRRGNVAMAAFSLGISNLRRRKTRTLLTVLTLVVMTFIILSFTSFVPNLQLSESASPAPARYPGLLLRNPGLEVLDRAASQALSSEFAGRAAVSRRVFSHDVESASGAAMSLERNGVWADVAAAEGLDAEEALVARPQVALVGGRWFKTGERDAIILPAPIAQALSAPAGSTVTFMGSTYQVIGIFDPDRMRSVTDLDGEPLMPPDYSLVKKVQQETHSQTRAFRPFVRLDPARVIILPAQRALDLRGDLRSVAAAFQNPA
ncbi:MAG: M28 family peptidase, partial [Sphingomonas sp.]|nr:M28 family peptidase [Sphingomonas sp.]